jgi:hypothetical protein
MLTKDFVKALSKFSAEKHVVHVQASMDPFYYDSASTEENTVGIVTDDMGSIWEICETDADNNIIAKQEVLAS